MGRGRGSLTSQDNGRGSGGGAPLVLECETEGLSDAQLTRIQKLKEEALRVQSLMLSGGKQLENATVNSTTLVNGTGASAVTNITNGTRGVVGVQVPQFLILQNGQMIATSSMPASNISTTNAATSLIVATTPAPAGSTTSTKTTTSTRTPTTTPPSSTSSRLRGRLRSKQSTSAMTPSIAPAPASKAVVNNSSDDIEVLSETRSSSANNRTSRALREVRIQGTSSPSTNTTKTTLAQRIGSSPGAVGAASPATNSTTTNTSAANTSNKYPLLNVVTRPRNSLPPSVAIAQRKELDTKVKLILVKSPQEFVEYLLVQGLARSSQNCNIHIVQQTGQPYKLKLGIFSDPKALATSGGYVWIAECCGKKYVSVYGGSIFGSTPIDKVPPTSVLKLVYHWACQTSIPNVESWVKVDKGFINKMYQYLRCVCSVMLQDKVYDFGFDGSTVELGIVSLGTSTADGTKKAVKVEILGLFDRRMKSYRLFASEPEHGTSSRQRFVRILKPLENVVHTNALILCDQSVDRNCLYSMDFTRLSVCDSSDDEDNLQTNGKIMGYLRKHVPKMFQSALSQLNLQQVQLVLDELCWRERFGHCAAQAYTNMVDHIVYLTAREAENPGLLHLLDFVAQSPQNNWRYKSQFSRVPVNLQPSLIMTPTNLSPVIPQVALETLPIAQTPLEHSNKVMLTTTRSPTSNATDTSASALKLPIQALGKNKDLELEPFYYGQVMGDPTLGHETITTKFICHICSMVCVNNIDFYAHLKLHLSRAPNHTDFNRVSCDYCLEHFTSDEKRTFHHRVKHMHMDNRFMWCRICTEGFNSEYTLINHMAKKHYESEMPYRCEVCNFVTSIFYSLIDHFNSEHKNTAYVQCHFCLAVKFITPQSSSNFSVRVYQHVQKHTQVQTKCKSCQLTFYSKNLMEDHKRKDHISYVDNPGLQRYKIPSGQVNPIKFKPFLKRHSSPGNTNNNLAANLSVAISSTLEEHELKIIIPDSENSRCFECKADFDDDQGATDHFKLYMKCTRCSFSTCCHNMITKHTEEFHPQGRTKKRHYKIGRPVALPQSLYCICGFSSRSGNHLARHLVTCGNGRKSAYPSVGAAMVYQGDVTGSMLSLASLGIEHFGTLSSVLPESAINAPPIDMSHFMSVTMDVDDN